MYLLRSLRRIYSLQEFGQHSGADCYFCWPVRLDDSKNVTDIRLLPLVGCILREHADKPSWRLGTWNQIEPTWRRKLPRSDWSTLRMWPWPERCTSTLRSFADFVLEVNVIHFVRCVRPPFGFWPNMLRLSFQLGAQAEQPWWCCYQSNNNACPLTTNCPCTVCRNWIETLH